MSEPEIGPFKCSHCDMDFWTQDAHFEHLKGAHAQLYENRSKPFKHPLGESTAGGQAAPSIEQMEREIARLREYLDLKHKATMALHRIDVAKIADIKREAYLEIASNTAMVTELAVKEAEIANLQRQLDAERAAEVRMRDDCVAAVEKEQHEMLPDCWGAHERVIAAIKKLVAHETKSVSDEPTDQPVADAELDRVEVARTMTREAAAKLRDAELPEPWWWRDFCLAAAQIDASCSWRDELTPDQQRDILALVERIRRSEPVKVRITREPLASSLGYYRVSGLGYITGYHSDRLDAQKAWLSLALGVEWVTE